MARPWASKRTQDLVRGCVSAVRSGTTRSSEIAAKTGPASPSWARQSGEATRHQQSEGSSFWTHHGTPIGHPDFVRSWAAERMHEELRLLREPHSNYLLRTMPPTTTEAFAARHGRAIMGCLSELLGCTWTTRHCNAPSCCYDSAGWASARPWPQPTGLHIAHVARPSSGVRGCRVPPGRERRRDAGHKQRCRAAAGSHASERGRLHRTGLG